MLRHGCGKSKTRSSDVALCNSRRSSDQAREASRSQHKSVAADQNRPKIRNSMPPNPRTDPNHGDARKPHDGSDLFFRTSSNLTPPSSPSNASVSRTVSRPLVRAYSLNSTGSIMCIPTLSESLHAAYGDRSRSRSAHGGPVGRRKCHSDSDIETGRAAGVRFNRVEIREYNRAVGE